MLYDVKGDVQDAGRAFERVEDIEGCPETRTKSGLFAVLWFRYDTLLYNEVTVKILVRIQRDYQRTRGFTPFSENSYDGT